MLSLLFFAHCLLIQLSTGYDEVKPFETHSISVYVPGVMTNGNSAQRDIQYKKGVQDDSAAAKGYFEDSLLSRGWGVLEIYTNDTHSPDDQAFAAGFLEGYITGHHIINNFRNLRDYFVGKVDEPFPDAVLEFMRKQYDWFVRQVANDNDEDVHKDYWKTARFVLKQYQGEVAGIQRYFDENNITSATYNADPWQMATVLNAIGDLLDIVYVLVEANDTNSRTSSSSPDPLGLFRHSMCTALVKVAPDFTDLRFGHSAWFTYAATNRIYKHYHLHFKQNNAEVMSFSSYAGSQMSLDDFYLMSSGLAMIQTTLWVLDKDAHLKINPEALLAWQRVRIANHLATDGASWFELYEPYNSGTYNNQYMVIDLNKFTPGKPLNKDLLWVIESIPGLTVGEDLTGALRWGYWASYNSPYFPEIRRLAGYDGAYNKSHNPAFSYDLAARGEIFRRDSHLASLTTEVMDLAELIRSNRYEIDPFSRHDPTLALCARGDLPDDKPLANGCYDTKATNYTWGYQHMRSVVQAGPTMYGPDLEPFEWEEYEKKAGHIPTSHRGLPDKYDFGWYVMEPKYPWTFKGKIKQPEEITYHGKWREVRPSKYQWPQWRWEWDPPHRVNNGAAAADSDAVGPYRCKFESRQGLWTLCM